MEYAVGDRVWVKHDVEQIGTVVKVKPAGTGHGGQDVFVKLFHGEYVKSKRGAVVRFAASQIYEKV